MKNESLNLPHTRVSFKADEDETRSQYISKCCRRMQLYECICKYGCCDEATALCLICIMLPLL